MKKSVLLLLFAVTTLFVACGTNQAEDRYVSVMLNETEHMTITSQNPVRVLAGEDAVFDVNLEDSYAITSLTDGASYENGAVVLRNVEYPATIQAVAKVPQYYWFEYRFASSVGRVETSIPSDKYPEGTEITMTAVPNEGSVFLGFSEGAYLEDGGTLLSSDPSYTFTLDRTITVYSNYLSAEKFLLTYHANGGSVVGAEGDTFYSQNSSEFYLCPNTLPLKGYFERDGYVLLGYNTEADGSGRYYGCGWNVDTHGGKTEELYCVWAPVSPAEDFEYETYDGGIRIRGYNGDDDFVVIPETIDGLPVTHIAKYAFADCTFSSIYITRNVESFLSNAFRDCKNLTSVYLTDNITQADDLAFGGCDKFKTLYINGVLDPAFSYAEMGICGVKFERLLTADPAKKKLTVISGSSSLYGLSTPQMEEAMGGEYTVINYGIHANTPCTFFMELVAAFTNPGDIVVNAPETMSEQWGSNDFNTTFWGIYECAFGALSYVDISHFDNVFGSFATFNQQRKWLQGGRDYDYYETQYTNEGDWATYRPNNSDDYVTNANGGQDFSRGMHQGENLENFNRAIALLKEKGADCLMSFSPINVNILSKASKSENYQQKYQESARDNYDNTLISDLSDYIMSGRYFYNTDLHPNTEGCEIRTARLARDILAYLNGENTHE